MKKDEHNPFSKLTASGGNDVVDKQVTENIEKGEQVDNPFINLSKGGQVDNPFINLSKGGTIKSPFIFDSVESEERWHRFPIDRWIIDDPNDRIFNHAKGYLSADVSGFYKVDNNNLNYFMLSPKKCYNNLDMRIHITKYLNYFEKFYDTDKQYMVCMFYIKYLLDFEKDYNKQCLIYDINRYILSESMINKVQTLVEDNYELNLTYRNIRNASLQYTNEHAKILLCISVLIDLIIPIITHFAFIKKVENIDSFLLEMFDLPMNLFDVDIYNKLYETSYTNVVNNRNKNEGVWNKQDIRGKNVTTHAISSVNNIILNIIPKYTFNENIISFNYSSIITNTKYQICDIAYEYNYIPLSSSKTDADNTSEFDRKCRM